MKKVFITGITGMVGSHLLDFIIENTDWFVVGLIRWRSPLDNISHHIELLNKKNRFCLEYGDLADLYSLQTIFKKYSFDIIFHLAAQSYPKTSFASSENTYEINVIGTDNILKCATEYCQNAVIHNCSSSEVFGRVPVENVPINEDNAFHPASPYAISKCSADLIGRYYAEAFNMNVLTTRMFTHTGPRRGDVFMESTFAKQIALIEKGYIEPKIKVGNLESVRTIADVRDAVKAYILLVTTTTIQKGSVFNIGGEYTTTVKGVLDELISQSQIKDNITIETDPDRLRPIDADLQIPDTTKFRNATGWKPTYRFEETMKDLLDYWRKNIESRGNIFPVR